jgi:hypothetical protein
MTQDEWWAETIAARESGEDTDEWPKRCPFSGEEIDEDGSHSCPDDCPHFKSAEFTPNEDDGE